MEASAGPKTFEQILEKIQKILKDESNSEELFDKIKTSDVKTKVILKQQLGNVLTDLENMETESSFKSASIFSKGSSSKNRLNNTQKMKVMEDLERIARKAEYLKEERKESEKEKEERKEPKKEKELVGREKEKEDIIDQLMLLSRSGDGASGVPVIIIAGIAGIGKTELALHVCKDQQLQNHVGLPTWVYCTSYNTFDAAFIAKQVIDDTTPSSPNRILILDDWRLEIRDQDVKELQEKLKLKEARQRVSVKAIMITTRSCLVARNIAASPVKLYTLPALNEKESASLFQKIAGRGAGDDSSITKIVGQCRGVPREIITMAKCLHTPPYQFTELTEKLIYFYYYDEWLTHLCFTYCSLFPRDYLFDAERLIHLWMAEGFLGSDPEKTGRGYLKELVGRSIFQEVEVDEFGQVRSCTMHPLMHDIATFLADKKNINVDPNGHKVHQQVLRASFDLKLDLLRGIPAPLFDKAKQLRSILFFPDTQSRLPPQVDVSPRVLEKIFKSFKSLSVLDLRKLGIAAVPSSIGEMKLLKYLDLSQNEIEKLPSSIAKLTILETLKLSGCYLLKELPKDFKNLAQLKHLDMEGCPNLTGMPREMSKLGSLQTLSAFVASKKDTMGGLDELEKLNNLRGHLEILYLDRVLQSPESGKTKYLEEKQHLQSLKLTWDLKVDEEKSEHNLALLDCLNPHPALGVLILVGYRGPRLSSWLTSIQFECLVKLRLEDCPKCGYLSEEDQLPKLKILELVRLDNLEYVVGDSTEEENSKKETAFYETLVELTIEDCPKLRSWWQTEKEVKERSFFDSISKLRVHHCPLLRCMPLYPRLDKEMVLENSSSQLLLDKLNCGTGAQGFPLENLHIQNCKHLENLSDGFKHLSSLQRLTIENCKDINLDGVSNQWEGLKSLRFLTITEIPTLRSLSFGDSVTTLRELTLHNCHGLTSISESIGNITSLREIILHNCHGLTSISDSIGKVTSLRRLVISNCNKMKSLPKAMRELKSLNTLLILDCALLLPRCQPETGDDWPQIRHIKHIQVK